MKAFEQQLLDTAVEPYRQSGKFAFYFARGKLSGDPVFKEILARGLIAPRSHVLDIGCGQGLLSAWLRAAGALAINANWPTAWAPAPADVSVSGLELMPADVARAKKAFRGLEQRFDFEGGDMCTTPFRHTQTAVILDVLHYVPYPAQRDVLRRVRDALSSGGLLILRVGDAAGGLGFKISNWVDSTVTFARGHGRTPLYCKPLATWLSELRALGFDVEAKPMSHGTPFANVLILARVR